MIQSRRCNRAQQFWENIHSTCRLCAACVTLVNMPGFTHIWPFLFNHLRDWFRTVTRSSKEGVIAVLNMSHYIQRRVMFLSSITLMANPSSPAEVIRFFTIPSVIVLSEAYIVTANWLWHQIGKNNQCTLEWVHKEALRHSAIPCPSQTATPSHLQQLYILAGGLSLWSFPAVSSTNMYCRSGCQQIIPWHTF